jgi:thiol-disulfide isomerase/thioredoxin
MDIEILIRILWTLGIILLALLAYQALNRLVLSRAKRAAVRVEEAQGEPPLPQGKPLILYFTTPTCAPCKTFQRPAIGRVQEQLGDRLQVVEIDAASQPEFASRWGVLSVPTTFILDRRGQPRHVNHGAAPAEKLLKQLEHL